MTSTAKPRQANSSNKPGRQTLLVAYSAGLAIPFLAVAIALPQLEPGMRFLRRWHRAVIMAMGVLIFTNAFARMAGLFSWFL